ncbi:predicted protein [Pyrenophora tritici-repentis Pt-1C-BFP]|uniref:Uncharacterized protein n=1 Tax=Pyrenophora tritici-repentis (strain Pt-1C-BFP) TaxID=426418 RepID=B2WJ41_PYRTR|nr:uncharacterized protein PTRG_10000 [Pyrenophora tritici-repentis Pt-1C-BFP]EDU43051.1 predicted protein [Pyrenophora tritici-repentis Pt-1C-BFP]
MDVRGVRYSAGENLLQTTINDIYSHREDADEGGARHICITCVQDISYNSSYI